ncbi:MAG: hypothetical protein V4642_14320 [Bacteroidota bacterium]
MNLELLISKYLDGDLTPEEDILLRKILSEEPQARGEFDGAALLHVEMQQDADSIIPPADLVSQTEDLILMKIMNHSIQDSGRPVSFLKHIVRRRIVNVFSMALVLLAFTIPFKDGSLNSFGDSATLLKGVDSQIEVNVLKGSSFKNEGNSRSFKRNSGSSAARNFSALSFKNESFKSSESVQPEYSASTMTNDPIGANIADASSMPAPNAIATITEAIRNSSVPVQRNSMLSQYNNDGNSLKDGNYPMPGEKSSKDEVQVSTFLATNILKNAHAAESAIASISQSVSYGINSENRVGVEMGYTAYTYEGSSVRSVQSSVGNGGGVVILSVEGNDQPQPPTGDNSKTATKPTWSQMEMPYVDQGRMYWGAAFYERQVVRRGNASLHGRLGLGGSGEGGVAYGRVFGKYDLLSAISFTMGAESRAVVKNPASVEKPEVSAALSIMYGLQIRF